MNSILSIPNLLAKFAASFIPSLFISIPTTFSAPNWDNAIENLPLPHPISITHLFLIKSITSRSLYLNKSVIICFELVKLLSINLSSPKPSK